MNDENPQRRHEPLAEPGEMALYNLVYCSRATPGVDEAAVAAILASARRNNAAHGITGLLVFGSGIFFQWLEGPRRPVLKLMDILQADRRHQGIVRLSEVEEVRERLFPDWDMERVGTEDIRGVLQDALEEAQDSPQAAALSGLLAQLDGQGELAALAPAA